MLCEMVLDHVDGVLLTGGGDIDPTRYGAITDETVRNVDLERDALECAMARAACRRNKPLFGICRGLQILNARVAAAPCMWTSPRQPMAVYCIVSSLERLPFTR